MNDILPSIYNCIYCHIQLNRITCPECHATFWKGPNSSIYMIETDIDLSAEYCVRVRIYVGHYIIFKLIHQYDYAAPSITWEQTIPLQWIFPPDFIPLFHRVYKLKVFS